MPWADDALRRQGCIRSLCGAVLYFPKLLGIYFSEHGVGVVFFLCSCLPPIFFFFHPKGEGEEEGGGGALRANACLSLALLSFLHEARETNFRLYF